MKRTNNRVINPVVAYCKWLNKQPDKKARIDELCKEFFPISKSERFIRKKNRICHIKTMNKGKQNEN